MLFIAVLNQEKLGIKQVKFDSLSFTFRKLLDTRWYREPSSKTRFATQHNSNGLWDDQWPTLNTMWVK
jgi:hypothetical protein